MKSLITFDNVIQWLEIHKEMGDQDKWEEILRLAQIGLENAKSK